MPPDHILPLSDEAGMRVLMPAELGRRFDLPIRSCSLERLLADRDLLLGALVVSPPGHIATLEAILPAEQPAAPCSIPRPTSMSQEFAAVSILR